MRQQEDQTSSLVRKDLFNPYEPVEVSGAVWVLPSDQESTPYLFFGVTVVVTLVLDVGGSQDLQVGVAVSQVLHRRAHVQGMDPDTGGEPADVKDSHPVTSSEQC